MAAIRGTEFLLSVDDATNSEIYVFDGAVAVANVQIRDQEVLVSAGEMTRVEPLRPPLTPRPFRQEEVDRLGRLGALERGEDPVLEASQEPAYESYLAFPDVTLDAPRNPAFLGDASQTRHTLLLSGAGYGERDKSTYAGDAFLEDRVSGYGVMARGFSAVPLSEGWTLGASAMGGRARDESYRLDTPPVSLLPELERIVNRADQGGSDPPPGPEERIHLLGGPRWGEGIQHRGWPAGSVPPVPTEDLTTTDNRVLTLGGGMILGSGGARKLGISLLHHDLSSTAVASELRREITGRNERLEGLFRAQEDWGRWAALVQIDQTETSEAVTAGGLGVYDEGLSVWTVRAGPALGLTPARNVAVSLDLVGGVSFESAVQHNPSGSLREDEKGLPALCRPPLWPSLLFRSFMGPGHGWIPQDGVRGQGLPLSPGEGHQ